jgi:hypothetical protein
MHCKQGPAVNVGQQAAALPDICVPTTSYRITRSFTDLPLLQARQFRGKDVFLRLVQNVEGPAMAGTF